MKTNNVSHRQRLLDVIAEYHIEIIDAQDFMQEVINLPDKYIDYHVVPENKYEDALHVALCTVVKIDILLSWNYRHLSNINKRKFNIINLMEGYSGLLRISTPMEVVAYEE